MPRKSMATADMKDVQRAFKALEPAFRKALRPAFKQGAEDVVRLAKPAIPVRFGFLRNFLKYKLRPRSGWAIVGISNEQIPAQVVNAVRKLGHAFGKHSASQYPSVYGRFVHEGTSRIKAHPFMMHAAEAERGPFAGHIAAGVKKAGGDLHEQWKRAAAARGGK